MLQFAWNPEKAKRNLLKHGVGFAEASSVFGDPLAREIDDPLHSVEESRSVLIGNSDRRQLLVVVYAEPETDSVRIISARRATPQERRNHEDRERS